MVRVDLNCDLGESFGNYTCGLDAQVIPQISLPMLPADFTQRIRWLWQKP